MQESDPLGQATKTRKLAELIRPFNMTVVAYDPFVADETTKELGVELVELDELMKRFGFASLHASLNETTRGLINKERLLLHLVGGVSVRT